MWFNRTLLAGLVLTAAGCASSSQGGGSAIPVPGGAADQVEVPTDSIDPATSESEPSLVETSADGTAALPASTAGDDPPETDEPTSSTTAPADATATTDPTTPDSTTTTVPGLDVYEPTCVVEVERGDSLGLIADEFDDQTVNIATIKAENDLESDVIYPGQVLDVCVDNGLDDVTGSERAPNEALADATRVAAVVKQQEKLNELFAGSGMRDLLVDGVSGPVTQQRLCAARLALGLDVTRADMVAGSDEEALLMETEELRQPFTTALLSERWILIDRTCQVMFTGEGDNGITNIFSTSTGSDGFETRDQDRSRAYRFDPALDNGGWHNSTTYPVPEDNPLNGNMYKPLYFDGGQAIHGSNNVPTTPQSKGCARLRVEDQERLIAWLGLSDVTGATYNERLINVTVNVQGAYVVPGEELFNGEPVDA
jgi:LysM repeat protein